MSLDYLRYETIGYGSFMNGPYGKRIITYADYTASGKNLKFLENYYLKLNEIYANTHTEDDFTGKSITELYRDAIHKIKKSVGANSNYSVFSTGTGATGAIDKLTKILGVYKTPEYWRKRNEYIEKAGFSEGEKAIIRNFEENFNAKRPVVFISAYEHHSNEIQWKEGYAEVVKIGLDNDGLFDLDSLKKHVSNPKYKDRMKIGSFSAASNVTGIKSPVYEIAKIMHKNGGFVFFDYASCAPYVEINMTKDHESYFDGIYLSMHKFLGGPGSTGILVLNNELYNSSNAPCTVGGGTVKYVTDDDHEYLSQLEDRENAGTPGIMQVIRAAMAFELKDVIGVNNIEYTESMYIKKAFEELGKVGNIEILGNNDPNKRISIMSFNIKYKDGYLHHGFVSTLLNDLFGIQSRAGCSCAGPYGVKLLNIDKDRVEKFKEVIRAEINSMKPGWTRVNFHYTLDMATFDYIISAIKFIAEYGHEFLGEYSINCIEGSWKHKDTEWSEPAKLSILDALVLKKNNLKINKKSYKRYYKRYLGYAYKKRNMIKTNNEKHSLYGKADLPDIAWFYHVEA